MTTSLNQMIEDLFSGNMYRNFKEENGDYAYTYKPLVNIVETPEVYRLEMVVPGIKKEDINISVEDKTLSISYEANTESVEENAKVIKREFSSKSFSRSFTLGNKINVEDISAQFENGILQLLLPKKEEEKPLKKQIAIG